MADGPLGPWTSGTCSGVAIPVGSDIQGILNSKPGGTTFCFAKGVHRLKAPLTPKANQTLAAQPGAVLDGSLVLRGWRPARGIHNEWELRGPGSLRLHQGGAGIPEWDQAHARELGFGIAPQDLLHVLRRKQDLCV